MRCFSRNLLGILASAALAATASAQYQVVWEDNFDGNTLDLSKWTPMIGTGCPNVCGWGNNELQYYRAENATVANGMLTITARRENFGGQQYTSARLRTLNKGDWKYGRFEMRAKLPPGQGMWPAFWLLPSDFAYGGWAASGEIDVMENVGFEPNRVHGTIHYGAPWPGNTYSGGSRALSSGTFYDSFHEFAVEWDEFEFRWYLDGQLYHVESSWWSSGGTYPAPFDQRFHILVNLAVGGDWPGSPNGSTPFPARYEIDYVRVLQEVENGLEDCRFVFDDLEHGNPLANGWFTFDGPNSGGAIGPNPFDLPPVPGNNVSLEAGWSGDGSPGYLGGFGRELIVDASDATHFEMWIKPGAGTDGSLEINLQDDDDGDGQIPGNPDGADDEFQYVLEVGPAGSGADLVAGGGWQHVSIPISSFVDDNSYHFGGNGVFDPVSTGIGGNGPLVAVAVALITDTGQPMSILTDHWRFTDRAGSVSGRVWDDLGGDGLDLFGEPGLEGVAVDLVDLSINAVVDTAITGPDGDFSFAAGASSFQLRVRTETLPYAATPTFDPDGTASTPNQANFGLGCGETSATNSFGYDLRRVGARFCSPAQPNSSGAGATISAVGSRAVSADDLTLLAESLPSNAFGFFIVSGGQTNIPAVGGSQGTLCVGPSIGRAVGDEIFNSGPSGQATVAVDLSSLPTPTSTVQVLPGDTWYFQGWFRDVNPQVTSNMTDGVGVTFQ